MPFLLIVFLMLACLPDVEQVPLPAWIPAPWVSALLTWSAVFFTITWAYRLAGGVVRAIEIDPQGRERVLRRYERGRGWHLVGLFVMFALAICVFGWGGAVGRFWRRRWPDGRLLPLPEVLVLAPFLSAMILSWVCFYDADRAAYLALHRPSVPDPLAHALLLDQELPLRSMTAVEAPPLLRSRWRYVLFKVRHTLGLVFIPLTLLLLQKELHRRFPEMDDWVILQLFLGIGVAFGVFLFMPWLVRFVLGLEPLPDGPLRRQLFEAARRLRFRCSNILYWNTHGSMANAMVLGLLPWPRYVVFTDRLLEEFTPEEVLAVFGHEVGHVKHHHMLYYVTFLGTSIWVLALLMTLLPGLDLGSRAVAREKPTVEQRQPPDQEEPVAAQPAEASSVADWFDLRNHPYLQAVPMMGLLLGYVFVVFGFVSRRCERQADVYGCRAVSCGKKDCAGHEGATLQNVRGAAPCPTGIGIFIQALEKVAALNGINRDRPGFLQSWQHSTIARRVAFLQQMLKDPAIEPRFQRRVLLVKCGLFLVLGVALLLLAGAKWGWVSSGSVLGDPQAHVENGDCLIVRFNLINDDKRRDNQYPSSAPARFPFSVRIAQ